MSNKKTELTVGKLADITGVNIETIRFYEKKGILPPPQRKPSGYRLYAKEDIKRVQFIIHAKELGFSLREIKELMELRINADSNCNEVRRQTEIKISDIEKKISNLQRIHNVLTKLAGDCRTRGQTSDCPVLEALEAEPPGVHQ